MRFIFALFLLLSIPALLQGQEIHEVNAMSIPGIGEDYSPVWLDSGFVMCAVRENAGAIDFRDAETGKPLSDLYWVPLKNGIAGSPVLFSAKLSTPVNEGPASFTDGGKMICYSRNLVLPKRFSNLRGNAAQLGLFFSRLGDGAWSDPEPFTFNAPEYTTMHPALSPSGDSLVFVSNRNGSLGGMDLFLSVRQGETWSEPRSLGPTVNSTANEAYPSFQRNGALVFSSDREGGKGKLDLYLTSRSNSNWTSPVALPDPINSPFNEMGYGAGPDEHIALFSSDRNGTDGIFSVKRTVPKFRECSPQQPNNYCYRFHTRPHAASASLPLDHVWDMGDGTRMTGLHADHCYSRPGRYTVKSLLVDRRSGQVFHTLSSNDLDISDHVQAFIAAPDTVRTGRLVALNSDLSHLPGMQRSEYHWDLGDGQRQSGSAITHQFRTEGTFEMRLDILSRPDGMGMITNVCNTRTIVVIDRFREHEDMAVTATYQDAFGNTHVFSYQELPFDPSAIDLDHLEDAMFAVQLFATRERISLDDPRFAAIRKFFPVTERFDPLTSTYIYLVGEAKGLDEVYAVFRKVKELQFLDAEVFVMEVEHLMDLSQLDLVSLEELNTKKLRTNAIHFAYKSAMLDSSSNPVLDQVNELLLQHKDLMLVIEAHTDDIGGRAYNVELSQQRARTVVEHLLSMGVEPERLIPIGHGKNQPIASNKSGEGRALNRRVEFRMVVRGEEQAYQPKR
jgi:outer membrane protein OmpA-like peptidoglycan-associated protein